MRPARTYYARAAGAVNRVRAAPASEASGQRGCFSRSARAGGRFSSFEKIPLAG
jgi:hypothetical protein